MGLNLKNNKDEKLKRRKENSVPSYRSFASCVDRGEKRLASRVFMNTP